MNLISTLHLLRAGGGESTTPQSRPNGKVLTPIRAVGGAWRYEFKYIVPRHLRTPLTADLGAFVRPDPYGHDDGFYTVRSLYLDTIDWRCLSEKSAGLLSRRKLRIRTYPEGGDGAAVKFEIKHRFKNQILKTVAAVDRSMYETLRKGLRNRRMADGAHFEVHPDLRRFFYFKQVRGMSPVVNVEFRRQAFIARHDRHVRITLDDALSGCRARDLFEPVHRTRRLLLGTASILEIKVQRAMPWWLSRLISKYHLRLRSVSKYCHAAELGVLGLGRLP